MATETSCSGPGSDCGSIAGDANPDVEPELSETPVTEDVPEKPAESLQSPPTSTSAKKSRFSISSILDDDDDDDDDDTKPAADLQQADGAGSAALTAEAGSSGFENKSDSAQLTFFYRDQLLCSQKTQSSGAGESDRSADAQISSWTVPPSSPFLYRKSSCFSSVRQLSATVLKLWIFFNQELSTLCQINAVYNDDAKGQRGYSLLLLRRLRNRMRTTIADERLNSPAILSIEKETFDTSWCLELATILPQYC